MEQVKSTWREAVHELSASNRALESEMRRLNLAHAEALGTQEWLESQLRTAQSRLNISARKAGQLYVDNQALRAQLSAANISAAILPPSMGAAEPAPAEGLPRPASVPEIQRAVPAHPRTGPMRWHVPRRIQRRRKELRLSNPLLRSCPLAT